MSEIDFTTALGRLLQDGRLRDSLALDPARTLAEMKVRATDREALQQLAPPDLEFQARVLLRKRFGLARNWLPQSCARLGEPAWETFVRLSRDRPPEKSRSALHDALAFAESLPTEAGVVCAGELNRLRFRLGTARLAKHWIMNQPVKGRRRWALQILLRWNGGTVRELTIYCGW